MIRIAHLSDSHFNERGRLADVIEVHEAFVRACAMRDVHLIVHAGDFFERASTPAERIACADFIQSCAEVAPFVGVKGNHDRPLELDLMNKLQDNVLNDLHPGFEIHIATAPGMYAVDEGSAGLYVCAVPWFDKAHIAAAEDVSASQDATRALTIDAARGMLDALRVEVAQIKAQRGIVIMVGHLLVAGSEVASGQTLIGQTVELSPADILGLGCSYAALGHVHMHQRWFDGRVAYSGSPNRCNYGEPEPKGFCLVTLEDDGTFVSNEFVELPARPMVLIEVDWTTTAGFEDSHDLVKAHDRFEGALVRLRVHIKAEDLSLFDEELARVVLHNHGAHEVKVEAIVVPTTRARTPEIAAARTTWEKVDTWLTSRGIDTDRERLRVRLGEIEGR